MTEEKNGKIIFIVGRPRSGTNFVRSILNLHSTVWISGEPKFFNPGNGRGVISTLGGLYPFDSESRIDELFGSLSTGAIRGRYWINPKLNLDRVKKAFTASDREWKDLLRIALQERAGVEGKTIYGEKTPFNLHRIPVLSEWYPNAKFLHIIRDPRAVFISEINREDNRNYRLGRINILTRFLVFIYICHDWSRNLRLHRKFMNLFPERYLFIRFSTLYRDRESEVRRICDFLELEFEEPMLDPPRKASNLPDDYNPLDGWKERITPLYRVLFGLFLGCKIRKYT
jgi:hypothetical protein